MAKITNIDVLGIYNVDATTDRCLMTVLTQDDQGLYAMYVGIAPTNTTDELRRRWAERIMRSGTKFAYGQAVGFYPTLTEEMYRR